MDQIKRNSFRFLLCMLTLFIVGLMLFLTGFFPYHHLNQNSDEFEKPTTIGQYGLIAPPKQYDRALLMIVDAMRYDFFNETSMPFAFEKSCTKLQLKVDTPTVTMPRIKSLIAGTLSSFADIVLNLGNTEQMEDSLLHRLRINENIIVFAGDRAWVNLFPNIFKRQSANMDSFFVNDFYEGDKNVTNIINQELQQIDWNMFIVHYLGLDHIGHVEGSTSSKIPLKLREMDDVIAKIHKSESLKNYIMLVTGDHGMRNGGGHGGSTKEELYVPLITFQENCVSKGTNKAIFKQIDVTPTLAVLMSTNIPKTSVGCIIPDLIQHMPREDQLYAYHYNAMHLLNKAKIKFSKERLIGTYYYKWLNAAVEMHADFLRTNRVNGTSSSFSFEKSKLNYIRASKELSDQLIESLVYFRYDLITVGIVLSCLVTINTLMFALFTDLKYYSNRPAARSTKHLLLIFLIAICIVQFCKFMAYIEVQSIMSYLFIVPIAASVYIIGDIFQMILALTQPFKHMCYDLPMPLPLVACFVFHTCSLASSSFIEEEHQTWYYFGASLCIGLCVKSLFVNLSKCNAPLSQIVGCCWREFCNLRLTFLMLAMIALLRKLNQTGDKWKHLPDIGDVLNKSENIHWLSAFFIFSLILLTIILRQLTTNVQFVACAVGCFFIYCYRGTEQTVLFFDADHFNSILILPGFGLCLLYIALYRYKLFVRSRRTEGYEHTAKIVDVLKTNLTCSLLVAALLHKPHNVILLFALMFTLQQTFRLCDQLHQRTNWKYAQANVLTYKTVLTIFIAKMFYFYQGNSNSLATIDLNPGYIGQHSYNPAIALTLVTLNTYSAHINAFLYLLMHMFEQHRDTLLYREKKTQNLWSSAHLETTEQHLQTVIGLFATATLLPTTIYLLLLILFRYHLFIYSVFAPKALYESFNVVVFYLNFAITSLYFMIVK